MGTILLNTTALAADDDIKPISRQRFDALAGFSRKPSTHMFAEELTWLEHANHRVLGVLIRDRTDDDFGGIVMGRDEGHRFRCVDVTGFAPEQDQALPVLLERMSEWSRKSDFDFAQGDRQAAPVDFFTPVVAANKLSEAFVRLATAEGFSPARGLIEALMNYYEDVDGNFVQQFQSDGFDSRFWELYVFSLLTEEGFVFDRSFSAPDFLCEGRGQEIFVEAVTVNPSKVGGLLVEPDPPRTSDEIRAYFREYMPIKWGSALVSKLRKEYWKLPHVQGKPIVLAIQDFHARRSMTFTNSTLSPYLYGVEHLSYLEPNGTLRVKLNKIQEHRWGSKTIESGFFYLPGAEMISAVIQNPTATLSKFNRIGQLAGFGSQKVKMMKFGVCYNPDPNAALPLKYKQVVHEPSFCEKWGEGLNVYHNPNARHPLEPHLFPDAMHHRLRDDQLFNSIVDFHPYSAETLILAPDRRPD